MTKNASRETYIYGIVDPRNGKIVYVGQSIDPESRLTAHVNMAIRMSVTSRDRWIRSLLDQGLRPGLKILESCGESESAEIEKEWIKKALVYNPALLNEKDNPAFTPRQRKARKAWGRKLVAELLKDESVVSDIASGFINEVQSQIRRQHYRRGQEGGEGST